LKIGKTLGIGTGTVQRVPVEQPRPFDVDGRRRWVGSSQVVAVPKIKTASLGSWLGQSWAMSAPKKITFAEMRHQGVRGFWSTAWTEKAVAYLKK
jgi:hypothetical protein